MTGKFSVRVFSTFLINCLNSKQFFIIFGFLRYKLVTEYQIIGFDVSIKLFKQISLLVTNPFSLSLPSACQIKLGPCSDDYCRTHVTNNVWFLIIRLFSISNFVMVFNTAPYEINFLRIIELKSFIPPEKQGTIRFLIIITTVVIFDMIKFGV